MKKMILLCTLLGTTFVFSQRLQMNEIQINAGLAGDRYAGGVGLYGGIDYGATSDISLGAELRFGHKNYNYDGYGDGRGNWIGFGVNGNYHFNRILKIPNKWDLYAGASLGFNSFRYSYPNNWNAKGLKDPYDSGFGISAQLGGRYYFSNSFGINGELSTGSLFNGGKLGVTFKL